MIRRPPRSTLFPYRRSSDLSARHTRAHDPTTLRSRIEDAISSELDRKSTRLNSSHTVISYAVFCLKKKNDQNIREARTPPTANKAEKTINTQTYQLPHPADP